MKIHKLVPNSSTAYPQLVPIFARSPLPARYRDILYTPFMEYSFEGGLIYVAGIGVALFFILCCLLFFIDSQTKFSTSSHNLKYYECNQTTGVCKAL